MSLLLMCVCIVVSVCVGWRIRVFVIVFNMACVLQVCL